MKIKKGDTVKIISGNDKGKQGKVLRVFSSENKILIEGINLKKKHVRPKQQGKKGELVKIALPLEVSRVMLVCNKCGKPARVGYKFENGRKCRICKRCGTET